MADGGFRACYAYRENQRAREARLSFIVIKLFYQTRPTGGPECIVLDDSGIHPDDGKFNQNCTTVRPDNGKVNLYS